MESSVGRHGPGWRENGRKKSLGVKEEWKQQMGVLFAGGRVGQGGFLREGLCSDPHRHSSFQCHPLHLTLMHTVPSKQPHPLHTEWRVVSCPPGLTWTTTGTGRGQARASQLCHCGHLDGTVAHWGVLDIIKHNSWSINQPDVARHPQGVQQSATGESVDLVMAEGESHWQNLSAHGRWRYCHNRTLGFSLSPSKVTRALSQGFQPLC